MDKGRIGLISFCTGLAIGIFQISKLCEKAMTVESIRTERIKANFRVGCKWIRLYQNSVKIKDYFYMKGINEVAIYGGGELGLCIINELENTGIIIKYMIDKDLAKQKEAYPCYLPSDDLPEVQAIIITPILEQKEISEQLSSKINAIVISLEQILDELTKIEDMNSKHGK